MYCVFTATLRMGGVLHPKHYVPLSRFSEGVSIPFEGSHYRMYHYIEGEHFDGSREQLISVAKSLATLHQAMRRVNVFWYFNLINDKHTSAMHDSEAYLRELDTIKQRIAAKGDREDYDKQVLRIIEELSEYSTMMTYKDFRMLKTHIIHQDLHPFNVLMNGQNLAAIIDLDSALVSQRARDIAFCMHRFSRTFGELTERKKDIGGNINERATLFLETYIKDNPLTEQEIFRIPSLIQDEAMSRALGILKAYYFHNDDRWAFDLEKHIVCIREAAQLIL